MAESTLITRRGLAKSLVAAGALVAAPSASAQTRCSTILVLFHRRRELIDRAAEYPTQDDEDLEALFYREADAIEAQMMALPCASAADFAAKFIVASGCGTGAPDWLTDPICAEARFLTGMPL